MFRAALILSLLALWAPTASGQVSDPDDPPEECETDPSEEAERADKAKRSDTAKALGLLTEQTVTEAFEAADVYWEERERAMTEMLAETAKSWRKRSALGQDAVALRPSMNTMGCQGLARRDTSVCRSMMGVEGNDLLRRLCIGMVTYLKLGITRPEQCLEVDPICDDPSDESCVRKKAEAGFVDTAGMCQYLATGDLARCKDAPPSERLGCLWIARELERGFTACQDPSDRNGCEAAIYVQIMRRGQDACDELKTLTESGFIPAETGAVDQCVAILNGKPERCPTEAASEPGATFRFEGRALLRASSGVAWLVQSAIANGPALCRLSSTISGDDSDAFSAMRLVALEGSHVPVVVRTRLGSHVHAMRSTLTSESLCVPTVSWNTPAPTSPR